MYRYTIFLYSLYNSLIENIVNCRQKDTYRKADKKFLISETIKYIGIYGKQFLMFSNKRQRRRYTYHVFTPNQVQMLFFLSHCIGT